MNVIGFDFGNCCSFLSHITDMNEENRMGGTAHDLLPGGMMDGIPSVFYYSKKLGERCGESAVNGMAKPYENRRRFLKKFLDQEFELDGQKIPCNHAITAVIQHCVRRANQELYSGWQVRTNQIALAYPATYSFAQRQRLIELAEQATLEDGTHLKVIGTIAEPAAAALDYLAAYRSDRKEATVLTYDLGGGTFDLALVAAYPGGRKTGNDRVCYYDVLGTDGISDLGGGTFDLILQKLVESKLDIPLTPAARSFLHNEIEKAKKDLSSDQETEVSILWGEDFCSATVTREEFEKAAAEELERSMEKTVQMLKRYPNQKPELILLTGGASQMPMVKKRLEECLPEYRNRIVSFRPSRAVSYGAARYGCIEEDRDPVVGQSAVRQRTMYDIGIRFYHNADDSDGYISTYIPAGTPIPFEGEYEASYTLHENQKTSYFGVYEAKGKEPDTEQVERDYKKIMGVSLKREGEIPKGTRSLSRLNVDELNCLHIEAIDPNQPDNPPIKNEVTLLNLS